MTTPPLLYSFRRCPYAIRARMALQASAVAHTVHEVALRNKPPALLQASPKGTVPVLVLADGTVLEQSLDIMRWALQQHDPHGWLAATPNDADAQQTWITRNDVSFKPLLDRYKYAPRHPELSADEHRALAAAVLPAVMDTTLQQQPYLLGAQASLADVALFPFIRQFAGVNADWFAAQPWPGLQRWLAHWLAHPTFTAAMATPATAATPTP